jgi:hypothetical protein
MKLYQTKDKSTEMLTLYIARYNETTYAFSIYESFSKTHQIEVAKYGTVCD